MKISYIQSKIELTKEFYQRPVKLQCVVCSDTFNVYTEHKCLMRESNQEFTIKYTQIKK